MWAPAVRIMAKDLRQRLRDRSAYLLAIVLPLALAYIYSMVFGPAAAARPFEYVVVNLDNGPVAEAFVTGVLDPLSELDVLRVRTESSVAQAQVLVDSGKASAAFVIPAGFSAAAQGVAAAELEIIANIDAPTAAAVARSLADAFLTEVNATRTAIAAIAQTRPFTPAELGELAQRASATASPLVLEDVSASVKVLDLKPFFSAGMAIFFIFFTVQFGISSLLDERSGGTLGRLLAAPIPPGAVLAGKFLASLLLGLFSMAILFTATALLMDISWGNPIGLALLVTAAVLAATGVAALIASAVRSQQAAGAVNSMVAIVLAMLGGAMFPISQLGGVIAAIGLATPHAWFLRGLGELAAGGGPLSVLPAVGAMLAFALVSGGLAMLRLRRVVRP